MQGASFGTDTTSYTERGYYGARFYCTHGYADHVGCAYRDWTIPSYDPNLVSSITLYFDCYRGQSDRYYEFVLNGGLENRDLGGWNYQGTSDDWNGAWCGTDWGYEGSSRAGIRATASAGNARENRLVQDLLWLGGSGHFYIRGAIIAGYQGGQTGDPTNYYEGTIRVEIGTSSTTYYTLIYSMTSTYSEYSSNTARRIIISPNTGSWVSFNRYLNDDVGNSDVRSKLESGTYILRYVLMNTHITVNSGGLDITYYYDSISICRRWYTTQGYEHVLVKNLTDNVDALSTRFHNDDTAAINAWETHTYTLNKAYICGKQIRIYFEFHHQPDGNSGNANAPRAKSGTTDFYIDNVRLLITFNGASATYGGTTIYLTDGQPHTISYSSGAITLRGCDFTAEITGTLKSSGTTLSHKMNAANGTGVTHKISMSCDQPSGGSGYTNYRAEIVGLPSSYSLVTVRCPETSQHDVTSSCSLSGGILGIPKGVFSSHGYGTYEVTLTSPNRVTKCEVGRDDGGWKAGPMFQHGWWVQIKWTASDGSTYYFDGSYSYRIFYPNGTEAHSETGAVTSTINGMLTGSWTIPASAPFGHYTCEILWNNNHEAGNLKRNFTVTALNITDMRTLREGGTEGNWYNINEVAKIKIKMVYAHSGTSIIGGEVALDLGNGMLLTGTTGTDGYCTLDFGWGGDAKTYLIRAYGKSDGRGITKRAVNKTVSCTITGLFAHNMVVFRKGRGDVWFNPHEVGVVKFQLVYAHDHSLVIGGATVRLDLGNGTVLEGITNATGWTIFEIEWSANLDVYSLMGYGVMDNLKGISYRMGDAGGQCVVTGIEVSNIFVNETFTETGKPIEIAVKVTYGHDGSHIPGATVYLALGNGTTLWDLSNATGWAVFRVYNSIAEVRRFHAFGGSDNNHDITYSHIERDTPKLVWTEIKCDEMSWTGDFVDIETLIVVTIHLSYAHNRSSVVLGVVDLNGTLVETDENGYATFTIIQTTLGERLYIAYGVRDPTGKIRKCTQSQAHRFVWTELWCDQLIYGDDVVNVGEEIVVYTHLTYAHNGLAVVGGIVGFEGMHRTTNNTGWAEFTITRDWVGILSLTFKGFQDAEGKVRKCTLTQSHEFLWTGIEIDKILCDDIFTNINAVVTISAHAVWAHNKSAIAKATLMLEGMGEGITNSSGWATWLINKGEAGEYLLKVFGRLAPDEICYPYKNQSINVIWTGLMVSNPLIKAVNGEEANVTVTILWAHNNSPACGVSVSIPELDLVKRTG